MAASVSWDQLRDLAGFHVRKGCAISIILDLDPAYAATAPEVSTKINSLLDTAEKREAGKRRTSTSVSTCAARRHSMSSSSGRVPWPIVCIRIQA